MNNLTLGDIGVLKYAVMAMEFNVRQRGPLDDQFTFEAMASKVKGRGPGGTLNLTRQEALCASALLPALAPLIIMDPAGKLVGRVPPSLEAIKATREKMEAWISTMPLH